MEKGLKYKIIHNEYKGKKEKGQDQQENSNLSCHSSLDSRKERETHPSKVMQLQWMSRKTSSWCILWDWSSNEEFIFCRWKSLSKLRMFLYILFIPIYVISTKVLCWFPLHPYYSLWPKYTNFVRGARMWSKVRDLREEQGVNRFFLLIINIWIHDSCKGRKWKEGVSCFAWHHLWRRRT